MIKKRKKPASSAKVGGFDEDKREANLSPPLVTKSVVNSTAKEEKSSPIKVITFWSPQATGTSTLTRALAAVLAKTQPEAKICLIDFDLYTPNLSDDGSNLTKVADTIFRGDFSQEQLVKSITPMKQFKNIYTIGGLTDLLAMDMFDHNIANALMEAVIKEFDYVLIDTSREINLASTLAAIDISDIIITPVIGRPSYIRNLKRYLDFLEDEFNFDTAKVKIVQNMYKDGHLTAQEIEKLLQQPIAASINTTKELETDDLPEAKPFLCNNLLPLVNIEFNKDKNKPNKKPVLKSMLGKRKGGDEHGSDSQLEGGGL